MHNTILAPQSQPVVAATTKVAITLEGGLLLPVNSSIGVMEYLGDRCRIQGWAQVLGGDGVVRGVWTVPTAHVNMPTFPRQAVTQRTAQAVTQAVTQATPTNTNAQRPLTLQARRVLEVLARSDKALNRKQLTLKTEQVKGWSALLGAPTKGDPAPHTLQGRGLVTCESRIGVLFYTITDEGRRLLAASL